MPVKWSNWKSVCGISVVKRKITAKLAVIFLKLVDPRRIELPNLSDAKRHIKLFCMISNYLWCFPLGFSLFPPLFSTLVTMCCTAVCGASCGQKRSLPFAGNGFPTWTGSIFRASDCLHCNSESEIRQVLSALSVPQKLGGCKQRGGIIFFVLFLILYSRFGSIPLTL